MKFTYLVFVLVLICNQAYAANALQQLQREYQQQGVSEVNPDAGKKLWESKHMPKQKTVQRSCTSCHGHDPRQDGKHAKTGKLIEPMAVSVNKNRFTKVKKIKKWFKRNCKWTFGRECSAQEQANILAYLRNQ